LSRRRSRRERLLDEALWMESFARLLRAAVRGERLIPLREVMEKAGITQEMLDQMPDVEVDQSCVGRARRRRAPATSRERGRRTNRDRF
jgi:hypothetical protein